MPKNNHKAFTVSDLLAKINMLINLKAITLDTKIIYSQDDEGNNYQACVFTPSIIYANVDLKFGDYLSPDDTCPEIDPTKTKTYLCIN